MPRLTRALGSLGLEGAGAARARTARARVRRELGRILGRTKYVYVRHRVQ